MSTSDILKSIVGMTSGENGKAILEVHEMTSAEAVSSRKDVTDATREALNVSSTGASKKMQISKHRMVVQYNPSTLVIQANAEAIPFTYLQQNIDSGIPNQQTRPPMVTLSVELYFDEMNPQDAFMLDKLRLSAGSIVSDVAGAKKLEDGGYTVQPQTNALLSTVLRPNTRIVTFAWGDMSFTGQIIEVEVEYTMFSPSGKPVRSRVQLNIAQAVESDAEAKYWDERLDEGLKDKGKRIGRKVENLLNLDMI